MGGGTSIIMGTATAVVATIVGTAFIVLTQLPKQQVDDNEHWLVMSMEAPAGQRTPPAITTISEARRVTNKFAHRDSNG